MDDTRAPGLNFDEFTGADVPCENVGNCELQSTPPPRISGLPCQDVRPQLRESGQRFRRLHDRSLLGDPERRYGVEGEQVSEGVRVEGGADGDYTKLRGRRMRPVSENPFRRISHALAWGPRLTHARPVRCTCRWETRDPICGERSTRGTLWRSSRWHRGPTISSIDPPRPKKTLGGEDGVFQL